MEGFGVVGLDLVLEMVESGVDVREGVLVHLYPNILTDNWYIIISSFSSGGTNCGMSRNIFSCGICCRNRSWMGIFFFFCLKGVVY